MPEDRLQHAVRVTRDVERRGRNRQLLYLAFWASAWFAVMLLTFPEFRHPFMLLGMGGWLLLLLAMRVGSQRQGINDDRDYWALSRQQRREVGQSLRRREVLTDPALAAVALNRIRIRTTPSSRWSPPALFLCGAVMLWTGSSSGDLALTTFLMALYWFGLAGWFALTFWRAKQTKAVYEREARRSKPQG